MNKLLSKYHVRYVDMILAEQTGQPVLPLWRFFFITTKKYDAIMEKKFSSLDERTKARIFGIVRRDKKRKAKAWKRRA